jgi:N-acetylmuramoyl-L-alanine amidase
MIVYNTSYITENARPIADPKKNKQANVSKSESNDEIIYKIQILTSDKKLSPENKQFKGYTPVSYYVEDGIYKYIYGEDTDYKEILKKYRSISKDFKGCFIIRVKDGKRIRTKN